VPSADDILKAGDLVALAGEPESVQAARVILAGPESVAT